MQKLRMRRINIFATITMVLGRQLTPRSRAFHGEAPAATPKWIKSHGNAGVYWMSIVGTKRYKNYKRKANRRLRAALGGRCA